MAGPNISQNLLPESPSLADVLEFAKRDTMMNLVAHHTGTIQSFDPDKQTAQVSINYKKTYFNLDPATQQYVPVLEDYPTLIDVPVIFLGGGKASLTFPVKQGDECLLLFNDRDIDTWFSSGQTNAPVATPRLHSIADGFALVGLRSLNNVLQDFDPARIVLQNDKAMVGVGPSLIKIANDQFTLNTLLQNLLTTLENLTTIPAAVGSPLTLAPTVIIQLQQIGTQLGELLE